ncbi:MAG: hypothetical protein KGQ41_05635 [Alphaproteobacteria bacterium]|nr:hypothetical protein [Alphaproteobacteria bacterium]
MSIERLMAVFYVVSLISGSYLAVSTVKSVFFEARRLELLASLELDDNAHKVLVFDAIEPASGR